MSNLVRELILKEFKASGNLLTLDELAHKKSMDREATEKELRTSNSLSNLCGLTVHQALKLIEFYGDGVVFIEPIEQMVKDFHATRDKIEDIERRLNSGLT